ncbi:hypothetical protein C6W19_10090, partial [Bacillus sp. RJGP41]
MHLLYAGLASVLTAHHHTWWLASVLTAHHHTWWLTSVLDCGSGVLSQLQNHMKPEDLGAVVLSHYHPDHVADIGVLQHAA